MTMFAPAHPGELIKETIEGLREETSNKTDFGRSCCWVRN